jgi:type I restriction enzyme S subunit
MKQQAPEQDFQETELGSIPADWGYSEVGPMLIELRNGLSASQDREYGEYAVTRIETISLDRFNPGKVGYVNNLSSDQIELYSLRPGDILFSHINSDPQIGRSVVYEGYPPKLLHGMNLLRIRVDESYLDTRYLSYLFAHYRTNGVFIKLASRAVNQSSINQGKLKALRVFLPPLPEQRRIAAVLNVIQDAIAAQEDVIAAARAFKRSLMQRLFTYGSGREPAVTKETDIGEIPAHWEVRFLSEIAQAKTSTSGADNLGKYDSVLASDEVKVLFLKVSDLNLPGNETQLVSAQQVYRTNQLGRLNTVPPQAIVFPKRGGAIGTNKKRMTVYHSLLDPNLIAVVAGAMVISEYLYYWFERFDLSTISDNTTIPQLNKKDIESIRLPLPTIAEQIQIADFIAVNDAKIAAEEDRKTALEALFKSMLHQLMTGQIRLLSDEGLPLKPWRLEA